jgi:hypothetical protein
VLTVPADPADDEVATAPSDRLAWCDCRRACECLGESGEVGGSSKEDDGIADKSVEDATGRGRQKDVV